MCFNFEYVHKLVCDNLLMKKGEEEQNTCVQQSFLFPFPSKNFDRTKNLKLIHLVSSKICTTTTMPMRCVCFLFVNAEQRAASTNFILFCDYKLDKLKFICKFNIPSFVKQEVCIVIICRTGDFKLLKIIF